MKHPKLKYELHGVELPAWMMLGEEKVLVLHIDTYGDVCYVRDKGIKSETRKKDRLKPIQEKTLAERFLEKYKGKKMWWTGWDKVGRKPCVPYSTHVCDESFIDEAGLAWYLYNGLNFGNEDCHWEEYKEPEYRPWQTLKEVPIGEKCISKTEESVGLIVSADMCNDVIYANGNNAKWWFDYQTMEDGSPCGVKI